MLAVGLLVFGACGSRSELRGARATADTTVGGSGGQNNSSGPGTTQAASAFSTVAGISVVTGPTSAAITTGVVPSTSSGVTTGIGGAPPCTLPGNIGGYGGIGGYGNVGGYGGEGAAPNDIEMCPIPFCNGWVPEDSNCAGIEGAYFEYSDQDSGGGSYIGSNTEPNRQCVSGHVNRVIDGRYDV